MKIAKKFYGYLKKDTLLLVKRKKYLYLSVLLPLLLALLFMLMLNPSSYSIKAGVCNLDHSQISNDAINKITTFHLEILNSNNCTKNLREDVRKGIYSLGIIIPEGFENKLNNLEQSNIIIIYDNTDISFSNLMAWKVDSSLAPLKQEIIDNINTQVKQDTKSARIGFNMIESFPASKYFGNELNNINESLTKIENVKTSFFINPLTVTHRPIYMEKTIKEIGITFIFPIIAMFIILMLSSTSIIYDKKTNFLSRVKASTNPLVYLLAKTVFFVFLTIAQLLIILIIFLIYGAHLSISFGGIINLILFVGIINALAGLIIGLISENEGIAILFSLMISFPLMLLSGIFSPIQIMPNFIQSISKILPLSYQINAAKTSLLFANNFSYSWLIIAAILLGITYYLFNKKVK